MKLNLSINFGVLILKMKSINKIAVFMISVLTAEILSEYIMDYILGLKKNSNPYIDTLIGMGVLAFIFFPLLTFIEKYLRLITADYLKHTKKSIKTGFIGLLVAVVIALAILYHFYLMQWHGINIFKVITNAMALNQ